MNNQQDRFTEIARRAFSWRKSALHEIHHAIGRARRKARTTIRVVNAWMPERITRYECARCGRPPNLDGQQPPHCPLCGTPAVARTWTRPAPKANATRPARYTEIADANPWKPLPDGDYRIVRKTRPPD
jgi:hypothetical protein